MDEFDVMREFKGMLPVEREASLGWAKHLELLPDDARGRVIRWASSLTDPTPETEAVASSAEPHRSSLEGAFARSFAETPRRRRKAAKLTIAERRVLAACPKTRFSDSKAISRRAKLTRSYALKSLKTLVEKGLVEREGLGVKTKYRKAKAS